METFFYPCFLDSTLGTGKLLREKKDVSSLLSSGSSQRATHRGLLLLVFGAFEPVAIGLRVPSCPAPAVTVRPPLGISVNTVTDCALTHATQQTGASDGSARWAGWSVG